MPTSTLLPPVCPLCGYDFVNPVVVPPQSLLIHLASHTIISQIDVGLTDQGPSRDASLDW